MGWAHTWGTFGMHDAQSSGLLRTTADIYFDVARISSDGLHFMAHDNEYTQIDEFLSFFVTVTAPATYSYVYVMKLNEWKPLNC